MKRTALLTGLAVMALSTGIAATAHATDTTVSTTAATATTTAETAMAADVSAKPSMGTKSFIKNASEANLFEMETSKLAVTKASSQQVKDFAQKMIDDHTKAGDEMKAALGDNTAKQNDVATSLGMMHKLKLSKLNKEEGASFDKDYVNAQVAAHNDAVKLFDKYANNGDDAALKSFAATTLPTLQEHKQMIDSIKTNLNKTSMK